MGGAKSVGNHRTTVLQDNLKLFWTGLAQQNACKACGVLGFCMRPVSLPGKVFFGKSGNFTWPCPQLTMRVQELGPHAICACVQADCLQGWAGAMDTACQALPDAQLNAAAESSCRSSMATLLAEAVPALHQVPAYTMG